MAQFFNSGLPETFRDTSSNSFDADELLDEYDSGLVPVREEPITDQMRQTLLGAKDPVEQNAAIALQGIQSGPESVPVPDSLKPKSLKQNLKDVLLGMVPFYGPVHVYTNEQKRLYDLSLYKRDVDQAQLQYQTKVNAAMKWHDAKINQDKEISTRQSKIKLLLSVYPNVPPSYIMKAAGVTIPTAKQVKMEPVMVRKYLKDGATIGEPEMAIYNPAMGVFTVTDPDTGEDVTIPRNLIASAQKMGTAGGESDPYGTRAKSLEAGLGRPLTEKERLDLYGVDAEGKTGSSAEERMAWGAAQLRFKGDETPEQQQAIYQEEYRKLKMMVPQFTSAAATQRATMSQLSSHVRSFNNSPITKRFNWVADAANFASKINPNTKNAADHEAIIYQFAKAMDPESVVREGEYATVKKYSQAWIEQIGLDLQRILDNKGLLTPAAIKKMQKTIVDRFNSTKEQYINNRKETGRMMDDLFGETGSEAILPDHSMAYPGLGQQTGASNVIVQKNKRTGAVRHSKDGGKTWLNGPPQ